MKPQTQDTSEDVLQREKSSPTVYTALQSLKRTGWVQRGVKNPESVKEHTESLILLARELSSSLSAEENDGLEHMLEVHDWPEALHGDEVILELRPDERKLLKQAKFENEQKALQTICADLSDGKEVMSLWLRFEHSDDPAASFGRQLDKYQATEKALYYEETQGIELFAEFLQYSKHFISHPVLLKRLHNLQLRFDALPMRA
jgi:putative hydrolase of HD superfamily